MATPAATSTTDCLSSCTLFDNKLSEKSRHVVKITALIVSLLILTVAIIAALVSTGILTEAFPLYSLGKIGQLASGILLTLSFVSTVVFGILVGRVVKERICTKAGDADETEKKDEKTSSKLGWLN